jgi:hypothetical protein
MWTKDYLVRGFVQRQRCRPWGPWQIHAAADYADEWQALYRVEDARRRLKKAKAGAEDHRQAVLAWDAAATREAVAAAVRAIGEAARAEAHRQHVAALRVSEERVWRAWCKQKAASARARKVEARLERIAGRERAAGAAVASRKFWAGWECAIRSQPRPLRGRPLDMGGPRDVWLSFELGDGKV